MSRRTDCQSVLPRVGAIWRLPMWFGVTFAASFTIKTMGTIEGILARGTLADRTNTQPKNHEKLYPDGFHRF